MLENIDKPFSIQEIIEKAKSITKYNYKHTKGLSIVKAYTKGK